MADPLNHPAAAGDPQQRQVAQSLLNRLTHLRLSESGDTINPPASLLIDEAARRRFEAAWRAGKPEAIEQ